MKRKKVIEKVRLRNHRRASIRNQIVGTEARPRLSVFRSNTQIYAQLIDDFKGVTLVAASSIDKGIKENLGEAKNRTEASKLVGKFLAERAKEKSITSVVFDRGGYLYTGRVRALAEGAREGGLEF